MVGADKNVIHIASMPKTLIFEVLGARALLVQG